MKAKEVVTETPIVEESKKDSLKLITIYKNKKVVHF